jgi:hypothetical protein
MNSHPLDALFTDATVPRCDGGTLYKVNGQVDGVAIQINQFLLSNLDPQGFQILEVVGGNVRTDLGLSWSAPLEENTPIPLTGGSILIFDDQPAPAGGTTYCITSGKFGSPTPDADAGGGRQLLFEITGARRGDCNGPDVPASLAGCDWRSPSASFPAAPPSDGGSGAGSG